MGLAVVVVTIGAGAEDEITVVVEEERLPQVAELEILTIPGRAGALDTGALLERMPGLRMVRNGALTGMPQIGGVFGERVGVRVDGMRLTPACPNHMDPPLHYVGPHAVEDVEVYRISPVRMGGDSLGAQIHVERQNPVYAEGEAAVVMDGEVGLHYLGSHEGLGGWARSRVGTADWSAGYSGNVDTGGDLRYPGGEVRATEYFSQEHHLFLAQRGDYGQWKLRGGTNRAEDVGTPSLPMDMIEDIGYTVGLEYEVEWDTGRLEADGYFHHVDHLMDRFTLRPFVAGPPAAGGNPPVETGATSRDWGGSLLSEWDQDWMEGGVIRAGTDLHFSALNAVSFHNLNGMFQDLFNDSRRNRIGFFVEWEQAWDSAWGTLLGVRGDGVWMESEGIDRTMNPEAAADAAGFNNASRDRSFGNADVVLQVVWDPDDAWRLEWNLGRKSRAPGYVELYNYTPAQSTAGLADGRTYVGNLDLDSEVAHQVEWVVAWEEDLWRVRVAPYYSRVSDFIQGRPQARLFAGQPVLRFENVEAEIYGVVTGAHWDLNDFFTLTGNLSYTRGRDVENDDNLYRIAPLHSELALEHYWESWSARVAVEWIDSQEDTAAYNGELPTAGAVLLNLQGTYAFANGVTFVAGIMNLADEDYEDHLDGINRVPGSDVAQGVRLPSPGRHVFATVSWEF